MRYPTAKREIDLKAINPIQIELLFSTCLAGPPHCTCHLPTSAVWYLCTNGYTMVAHEHNVCTGNVRKRCWSCACQHG